MDTGVKYEEAGVCKSVNSFFCFFLCVTFGFSVKVRVGAFV